MQEACHLNEALDRGVSGENSHVSYLLQVKPYMLLTNSLISKIVILRDWSLITGSGGGGGALQNGRGGGMRSFTPPTRGGWQTI